MKFRLLTLLLISFSASWAQTKELTPEQMLKGAPHKVTQPLPRFVKWMGDHSFLLNRNGKTFLVDCKTGKETEFTEVQTPEAKPINEVIVKNNDLFHNCLLYTSPSPRD